MLALAGAPLPSSSYRPLIRHALCFMQTRHNQTGVPSWKQNKQEKKWKKYDRGHRKGIFSPITAAEILNKPAFQERVQSLPVLPELTVSLLAEEENTVGLPTSITPNETHPFAAFGTPKTALLESRLLSRHATIIRESTSATALIIATAQNKASSETRVCFTGRPGVGKTHALLQTVHLCYSSDWIVIYIPRAYSLINSTSLHTYDLRTQTYVQPIFAYQTLQRILTVNRRLLENMLTINEHVFEKITVPEYSPLIDLIEAGLKDNAIAPAVLDAFMAELEENDEYPVLLAVDDFQALFARTLYKDPHFEPIQSYHLSMPRLLMQFASGQRSFARGAVFGALNASNQQFPISNDVHRELDLDEEKQVRWQTPYEKQHKAMRAFLKGIWPLHIPESLTPTEAEGIFQLWVNQGAIFTDATDELFLAKYTESSGNPRDFVWNGLFRTLQGAPLVIDKKKPYAQYHLP